MIIAEQSRNKYCWQLSLDLKVSAVSASGSSQPSPPPPRPRPPSDPWAFSASALVPALLARRSAFPASSPSPSPSPRRRRLSRPRRGSRRGRRSGSQRSANLDRGARCGRAASALCWTSRGSGFAVYLLGSSASSSLPLLPPPAAEAAAAPSWPSSGPQSRQLPCCSQPCLPRPPCWRRPASPSRSPSFSCRSSWGSP